MTRFSLFAILALAIPAPAAEVVKVLDRQGREWAFATGGALVGESGDGGWMSLMQMGFAGKKFEGVLSEEMDSETGWQGTWSGAVDGVEVERRYRLDKLRGVLQIVDTLDPQPPGNELLQVEYSGLWPVKEVAVTTGSGRAAEDGFGRGDQGIVVPGRYGDAGVLVAGQNPQVTPELTKDSKNRALWGFILPWEKCTLVQVVVLGDVGEGAAVLQRAFARGEVVDGVELPLGEGVEVANFSAEELDGAALPSAPDAGRLRALNEFARKLGITRGLQDVLVVAGGSSLAGTGTLGPLKVQGAAGVLTVSPEEVAGIAGGAGRGRVSKIFLRDGRVLCGEVESEPLELTGDGGWKVTSEVAELEGAVFALEARDGTPPAGVEAIAGLVSGDVVFLDGDGNPKISVVTPWGGAEVALDKVEAVAGGGDGFPGRWLLLEDGSRIEIFMDVGTLPLSGGGSVPLALVETLWKPGAARLVADEGWAETPAAEAVKIPESRAAWSGVWLAGGSVVACEIAGGRLKIVGRSGATEFDAGDVVALRRDEGGSELAGPLVIELSAGDTFRGHLDGGVLETTGPLGAWQIPAGDVVAFLKR